MNGLQRQESYFKNDFIPLSYCNANTAMITHEMLNFIQIDNFARSKSIFIFYFMIRFIHSNSLVSSSNKYVCFLQLKYTFCFKMNWSKLLWVNSYQFIRQVILKKITFIQYQKSNPVRFQNSRYGPRSACQYTL